MWLAIFFVSANGKRIKIYLATAKVTDFSMNATGALVVAGLAFRIPGKKKDAGETLWLALMPPQPLVPTTKASATNIATSIKFQFNLTCAV
jgi:hypothetical protein